MKARLCSGCLAEELEETLGRNAFPVWDPPTLGVSANCRSGVVSSYL